MSTAKEKTTEDRPDDYSVVDTVLRAQAILNCYVNSLGDERADDRYILWTVDEILDEAKVAIEQIPKVELAAS